MQGRLPAFAEGVMNDYRMLQRQNLIRRKVMNLKVQEQTWSDFKRHLIYTEGGSVQLEFYDPPCNDGTTAYIGNLWVDENHRRKGIATALMDKAEEIARTHNHEHVTLFWAEKSTPKAIFEWYKSRGYVVYYRDSNRIYLRKMLQEKK